MKSMEIIIISELLYFNEISQINHNFSSILHAHCNLPADQQLISSINTVFSGKSVKILHKFDITFKGWRWVNDYYRDKGRIGSICPY